MDRQLAYLVGQFEAEKPHRLTESQMNRAVTTAVRGHVDDRHKSDNVGSSLSNKAIIAIATGCGAAAGAIAELIRVVSSG